MFEALITGVVQGIAEWLPVSSEGLIVLIKTNFFNGSNLGEVVRESLFLHLGTFFAALVYFRHEVARLVKAVFKPQEASEEEKMTLRFLVITTIISGGLGYLLLSSVSELSDFVNVTGKPLNYLIGALLIFTALLQMGAGVNGTKGVSNLGWGEGVLQGVLQALAALPGVSRSGITVSGFLLRGFDKEAALRLSFLMSMPIVLGGNIILNSNVAAASPENILAFAASFIFGLLTIDWMLKLARKINFGHFVLGFGILTILLTFVI